MLGNKEKERKQAGIFTLTPIGMCCFLPKSRGNKTQRSAAADFLTIGGQGLTLLPAQGVNGLSG